MGPPSCSLRPPLLPFEGLFLREDEAFFMMVLFPHIYSKHHAVLMFNVLHVPMVTSQTSHITFYSFQHFFSFSFFFFMVPNNTQPFPCTQINSTALWPTKPDEPGNCKTKDRLSIIFSIQSSNKNGNHGVAFKNF